MMILANFRDMVRPSKFIHFSLVINKTSKITATLVSNGFDVVNPCFKLLKLAKL